MAQAIVLFASEAASNGRGLGEEIKMRVRLVLAELRKEPDRHIFFTRGAPGHEPPELFSNLVCKELEEGDIAPDKDKSFW